MKIGPRYRLPFRRRFEKKTDYKKRLKLLYSKENRLVVRKSLKHTRAQIISFDLKGDRTLVSASSQDLKKLGWNYPSNNTVSSYLIGLLIGKKALNKNIKSAVLDIGLHKNSKGSKVYAVLKGAVDAGLSIPHSTDVLPTEERLSGKHIIDYAQKLKKESEKEYKKRFSKSQPEKIQEMFDKVKAKIMKM
jgi:large subunit ribosomal protein L18